MTTVAEPAAGYPGTALAGADIAEFRSRLRGLALGPDDAGFGEEKDAMARFAYGPNYDGLGALKSWYDPGNLIRMNLNIKPETAAAD